MPAVAGTLTLVRGAGKETLAQLAGQLPDARLNGPAHLAISGVSCDSRRVAPGDLFVAVAGERHHGDEFLAEAVSRGAAALVSDRPPQPRFGLPWIQVKTTRVALALLARRIHQAPDSRLQVVGITGTNGKTTTAVLLAAALEAAGRPAGVIGTLGTRLPGGPFIPGLLTTPEAPDLYADLDAMAAAGCRAAVLEVSSHALALNRVLGMEFAAAVFTNLTRDHLDFHKNMENYFAAKARLFTGLPPNAAMAVNLDDPFGTRLYSPSRPRVVTYGRATRAAVLPLSMEAGRTGTRLKLKTPAGEIRLKTPLVGLPNVYNVMAALATAAALELDLRQAAQGIASVEAIPGRAEAIDEGQPFQVLIDFAHTDDALMNILKVARDLTDGRVILVFGCGGDRDRSKRPLMGAAAAQLAHRAIITSDNPRSESPEEIIRQVVAGFDAAGTHARRAVEPDRIRAIQQAVAEARHGDLVLIAGKGHESVQIVGNQRIPLDDGEVVRQALRRRLGKED
ncbi:MAG: UDP-N-acetylmuramoyl-L-alanyl-D-glutamate--2,6-diaminopimelate ligase [Acidobacteriota bacterium]